MVDAIFTSFFPKELLNTGNSSNSKDKSNKLTCYMTKPPLGKGNKTAEDISLCFLYRIFKF